MTEEAPRGENEVGHTGAYVPFETDPGFRFTGRECLGDPLHNASRPVIARTRDGLCRGSSAMELDDAITATTAAAQCLKAKVAAQAPMPASCLRSTASHERPYQPSKVILTCYALFSMPNLAPDHVYIA